MRAKCAVAVWAAEQLRQTHGLSGTVPAQVIHALCIPASFLWPLTRRPRALQQKMVYELPYIALVFESEHKAKSSGRSQTKFDGVCEARRIVPH